MKIRLKDDLLFEAAQGIHFFKLYADFDRKKLCADILEYAREYREKVEFWMLSQLIHENHPTTDDSAFINVIFFFIEKFFFFFFKNFMFFFLKKKNFLQYLIEATCRENYDACNKIIRKFKLNVNNYPNVLAVNRLRMLRWQMRNKPWYVIEESFCDNEEMLGEVALAFFQFKGPYEKRKEFSEAANSLIARYDLLNKKTPCKNQLRSFMKNSTSNSPVPIKNPLFQNDLFGPMEENIRTAQTGTFVSMKDFGVLEKDVFFVDNIKDSNFTMAKNILENSEIVKFQK